MAGESSRLLGSTREAFVPRSQWVSETVSTEQGKLQCLVLRTTQTFETYSKGFHDRYGTFSQRFEKKTHNILSVLMTEAQMKAHPVYSRMGRDMVHPMVVIRYTGKFDPALLKSGQRETWFLYAPNLCGGVTGGKRVPVHQGDFVKTLFNDDGKENDSFGGLNVAVVKFDHREFSQMATEGQSICLL